MLWCSAKRVSSISLQVTLKKVGFGCKICLRIGWVSWGRRERGICTRERDTGRRVMVTLDGRAIERLGVRAEPLLNTKLYVFFSTDLVETRSNPTTRYESIYGRPYQDIPAYVICTSGFRTDKHKVQGEYRRITSSCPVAEYSPQVNGSTTTAINNKYQSFE